MIDNKFLPVLIVLLMALVVIVLIGVMLYPDPLAKFAAADRAVYAESLFSGDDMITVDIAVDPEEWQSMLDHAVDEEYIRCDLTVNGVTYPSVGIRPKGNSSLTSVANSDSDRYSFRVEFDNYVSGQTCDGLDVLILNNLHGDATYMKEYLSYDMMQTMGVATPLYAYAEITVNGAGWGCYFALEGMEEAFAQRVYGSNYGKLYNVKTMDIGGGENGGNGPEMPGNGQIPGENGPPENGAAAPENGAAAPENGAAAPENGAAAPENGAPAFGAENPGRTDMARPGGGKSGGGDLVYTDDDPASYSAIFDNAVFSTDTADEKRVIAGLKQLSNGENLEEAVDVDQVLRYFAVHTFVYNLDSYISNMQQNYYLYEKGGQISILPWDYNLAFGGFGGGDGTAAVNFPIDTPVSNVALEERPLLNNLLAVTEYRERYHAYLRELCETYVESGLLEQRTTAVAALIDAAVAGDATAFYSYEAYQDGVAALLAFCHLRAASIEGQLAGTIPSTSEGQAADDSSLIDGSSVDLGRMGQQGGGQAAGAFGNGAAVEMPAANGAFTPPEEGEAPDGASTPPDGALAENRGFGMEREPAVSDEGGQNYLGPVVIACALAAGFTFVLLFKRKKLR